MRRHHDKLLYVSVILILGSLWITLTVIWPGRIEPFVSPLKLPSPMDICRAAGAVGFVPLLINIGATFLRVAVGGLLGTLLGWLTGLLMSQVRALDILLNPLIE